MFVYEKKLEYPVRIRNANPALAKFICSQYGGPDGELGASLRYLSPVSYTHLVCVPDRGDLLADPLAVLFAHHAQKMCIRDRRYDVAR